MASIIANLCIARVEYVNRVSEASFLETLGQTWWWIVILQWGLYRCWNGAPSFMFAWAFFWVGNMALRLIVTNLFLHEPISLTTYAGVALALVSAYLVKIG